MEFKHVSVLLDECIEGLNIKKDGIYIDGTLGGAGHAKVIAEQLSEKGMLIGFDQDIDAINTSKEKFDSVECKVELVHSNYEAMALELEKLNIEGVDGILLDLGVSSYQLDTAERGFSYMHDAPLDMRMNRSLDRTAKDIVNTYDEKELIRILKVYGEERFASRIAKNIIEVRQKKSIETTKELVQIIDGCIPTKFKINYGHPAKRTFQALRIEVNRELEVLENTLDEMIELLNPKGRLCVITFHSLEDRIVKRNFKKNEDPCTCPKDFPVCACGLQSKGKMKPRKPILPSKEEMEYNSRSKSAKLRIFERVGE